MESVRLGAATLTGSLPGTSPWEAIRIVRGELPDMPILPEFPERGPGADMIGRTMSMVARVSGEFSVETTPTGWRLGSSRSHSLSAVVRRALAWLGEDFDAAELAFNEFEGSFKIAMVGPWTLAGSVELPNGELFLSDPGATAELHTALAEAVGKQLEQLSARLPRAKFFVQFDEPRLPQVLSGQVATASGLNRYGAIDPQRAAVPLSVVFDAATAAGATPGVHSCAKSNPVTMLRAAGAQFLSLDLSVWPDKALAREFADTDLGEFLDRGGMLLAGLDAVGVNGVAEAGVAAVLRPLTELLNRLGIPANDLDGRLLISPACGLVALPDLDSVRAVCELLAQAGRALRDERVDGSDHDRY